MWKRSADKGIYTSIGTPFATSTRPRYTIPFRSGARTQAAHATRAHRALVGEAVPAEPFREARRGARFQFAAPRVEGGV